MKPPERRGNDGLGKTEENQNQVSPRFPPALGNRKSDSHILHSAQDCLPSQNEDKNQRKELALRARLIFTPSGSFFD
jgi:hypothetical protein